MSLLPICGVIGVDVCTICNLDCEALRAEKSAFPKPEIVFPPETSLLLREPCPLASVTASEMETGDADRFRLLLEAVLNVC